MSTHRPHIVLATTLFLGMSVLAQLTSPPTTQQGAAIARARAEIEEYQRNIQTPAEQRKRFTNLLDEYHRLYTQGLTDKANALIPEIIASCPPVDTWFNDGYQYLGQAGTDQLSQFVDFKLLQRNQKDAALAVIKAFPQVSPGEVARLFPPNNAPDNDHNHFIDALWKWADSNDYWIWVYFRYLHQTPRARELATPTDQRVKDMEQSVRQAPGDLKTARQYAVAMAASTAYQPMDPAKLGKPGKCDWMGDVCRPANASDYILLARAILATGSPEGASHLLRAGLSVPLTKADAEYAKRIRRRSSILVTASDEQMIRQQIKSDLMHCLELAGHSDEVAEMMKESKAPPTGREAGKLDRGKANPLFEKAILEDAATKGDSPQYWMDRADYYAQRGDHGSAETAYDKAMALAKPEGTRNAVTKSWVLARYIDFIAYEKQDPKAGYEKLWSQTKDFPPERVCRLVFDYRPAMEKPDYATGNDSRLWAVLNATPVSTIVQMRIIEKMIKYPATWSQEQVIAAVMGYARGADTTRSAAVADALMMTANDAAWRKEDAQAQKLYRHAAEVLEEAVPRAKSGSRGADYLADPVWSKYTLLEAYQKLKMWDKMLQLYPETDAATGNYPSRKLAVAAARAGDKALAMRHWDRSLSIRPDKPTVLALAQAGCRDDLISRARQVLKTTPNNEGARDVLTWLDAPLKQN